MLCMLVRLYISYSLFMQLILCITLVVLYIRIKVNVMCITLQDHKRCTAHCVSCPCCVLFGGGVGAGCNKGGGWKREEGSLGGNTCPGSDRGERGKRT